MRQCKIGDFEIQRGFPGEAGSGSAGSPVRIRDAAKAAMKYMFQTIKHAHFVGIGGIGMSALAKWFLREGVMVSGSDVHASDITDEISNRGVKFYLGHASDNVVGGVDLLIYSSAVPFENVERVAARERGIREMTNFEFLGEVSKGFSTIVVSGTNGKSTTTAMLGLILEAAGFDPTVLVGSLVPSFPDGNIRVGKGKFFVVEGCEYRANMLNLYPQMIVLTNIEEDHLDYYRDLAHIQATFQKFVDGLGDNGKVVYNADDSGIRGLCIKNGVGFGFGGIPPLPEGGLPGGAGSGFAGGGEGVKSVANVKARNRLIEQGTQSADIFCVHDDEKFLGSIKLMIPGSFNMMNALAATTAAMELGVTFDLCARTLLRFQGLWRRFERVGLWKGADVISDYGHHPSAIKLTIAAAREFFPGRRIVLCYQPHQHDRTKKLFNEFVETLPLCDHLIITEIYEVAGRNEVHDISSRDIVQTIKEKDSAKDARYACDQHVAEDMLRELVRPGDVIIIMGAGDIDELARKLAT